MIHTMGITEEDELIVDFPLSDIKNRSFKWYWIDIDRPDEKEEALLHSFFHFHPLAIEDCLKRLQRPKLDYYQDYTFFVLHSICHESLKAEELNMFLGENYVITFHYTKLYEIDKARDRIILDPNMWDRGHVLMAYHIFDSIVDNYFPLLYDIEDQLNAIDESLTPTTVHLTMESVFDVRGELLQLRRTIVPMRELLYRMLGSVRLGFTRNENAYFSDIYDNILRLGEILESNREITADIRDSQLSINSNQMNRIMMTLTIISSVFIPLTFIAGLYGMNFEVMPEFHWRYGYVIVLFVMIVIGLLMLLWFKRKGWLRIFKS